MIAHYRVSTNINGKLARKPFHPLHQPALAVIKVLTGKGIVTT
jgi:hypothetical protein